MESYKPFKIDRRKEVVAYVSILVIIGVFAGWAKHHIPFQPLGYLNVALAVMMLSAYISGNLLKIIHLPLISGYILTGIVLGPFVVGFLSESMVHRMQLLDDLALGFIAMAAGAEFHLAALYKRFKAIWLNIGLLTLIVFSLVVLFILIMGQYFDFTQNLLPNQLAVLALFLGVIAVARSPSSAIAIIRECRAKGTFTETALGVTIAMDVLIIMLFTLTMAVAKMFFVPQASSDPVAFLAVLAEIVGSIVLGLIAGKAFSIYIERSGHDIPLYILFFAFGVSKTAQWVDHFMETRYHVSVHLEPLIICMAAGFFILNFSQSHHKFVEALDRVSLPIYVLFFSMSGASLNLDALKTTWPLAVCLATIRILGIFIATWMATWWSGDPPARKYYSWMAYITQAGVAIGLAQLARQQFPETGIYLTTIVLAVITLNQMIGPVMFKLALNLAGDTGRKDRFSGIPENE